MSLHIQLRCRLSEVGDLEFDGMQGDTVACGQTLANLWSIFVHKEP